MRTLRVLAVFGAGALVGASGAARAKCASNAFGEDLGRLEDRGDVPVPETAR